MEVEEEKERTSVLWTSLGEKRFIKSIPWQLRTLLLTSFPTPTPFVLRALDGPLRRKERVCEQAIKLHNVVNTFILKLKQAKSAAC